MAYIKKDVTRTGENPGIGISPKDRLVLIDIADIRLFPKRENGITITEDIILKDNEYSINIYTTPGTMEVTSNAEGDLDAMGYKPSVKFKHPGNHVDVREFKAACINRKYIALIYYCNSNSADIIGSPCNPCKVTPAYTGNSESNSNEFVVEQINKGEDIGMYNGAAPTAVAVTQVATPNGVLAFAGSGRYESQSGEGTITSIENGAPGDVVTIVGGQGSALTVGGAEGNIMLTGTPFTVAPGSQITLKAMQTSNGVVWVETSRYDS